MPDDTPVSPRGVSAAPIRHTALHDLHVELGARMVEFAGWSLPLHYPAGIMVEHRHCRSFAALFDVSHMGQLRLNGPDVGAALERLVPSDIQSLGLGRARYTVFCNEQGGVIDDLIVGRGPDGLDLVVNAGCVDKDVAHLREALPPAIEVEPLADQALLALQGPSAHKVLEALNPATGSLRFMQTSLMDLAGVTCRLSRLGYTGEDGFEISLPADQAVRLARDILAFDAVRPAGLGARDSLRLEAGLCLYGHELDETTTPVAAGLGWIIGKRRRTERGFLGADVILEELERGSARRLVGLRPNGRALARDGVLVIDDAQAPRGQVTSGGFAPTLNAPVSLAYVDRPAADGSTALFLQIRGRAEPAAIADLPFVPHRYRHGSS